MPVEIYPGAPPPKGIYIENLHLHNAVWNSTKCLLNRGSGSAMPVVWLRASDSNEPADTRKHREYICPIYISPGMSVSHSQVTSIPLPTVEDPNVWTENKVYLSSRMG